MRKEYQLIIDTKTDGHNEIIEQLSSLESTIDITDNGQYRHCPECSQLSITTTKTEDETEHWLWENNLSYIGVVTDDN